MCDQDKHDVYNTNINHTITDLTITKTTLKTLHFNIISGHRRLSYLKIIIIVNLLKIN